MGVMSPARIYANIAAIAVIPTSMLVVTYYVPGFEAIFDNTEPLTREVVYIGGATITAFALFGSILSIGIITDRDKKLDELGLKMVYGGTTLIVTVQGLNMLFACCLIFNVIILAAYTSMTFVSAAIIILGFGRIVGRQLSESKKSGRGQSGKHDGEQGDTDKTDTETKREEGQSCAKDGVSTDLQFRFRSGRETRHSPTRTESIGQTD